MLTCSTSGKICPGLACDLVAGLAQRHQIEGSLAHWVVAWHSGWQSGIPPVLASQWKLLVSGKTSQCRDFCGTILLSVNKTNFLYLHGDWGHLVKERIAKISKLIECFFLPFVVFRFFC